MAWSKRQDGPNPSLQFGEHENERSLLPRALGNSILLRGVTRSGSISKPLPCPLAWLCSMAQAVWMDCRRNLVQFCPPLLPFWWQPITTNKASGGDGIPVELFQILKDDAVKVLHSISQQIWKTQQWPHDWKTSVFILIPKKGNTLSHFSCVRLFVTPWTVTHPGFSVHGIL